MRIILGIDPGSRITGYGVIASNGNKHQYITSGSIHTQSKYFPERCRRIYKAITEIMQEHRPEEAAIEQVFMAKNPAGALKLGQARGAALVAMAEGDIPIAEYSPRTVKKSVVGYGAADKVQVQHMVKLILNLSGTPQADAADALAIAICHAHSNHSAIGVK